MNTIVAEIWSKSKILIKALTIGVLILLLLIPTYYVQDLIQEREARQKEAIAEVSQKWAGKQTITGPVLVIPYTQANADSTKQETTERHFMYFLPDNLSIKSTIVPQEKHRGIYKVMLYASQINLSGRFDKIPVEAFKVPAQNILWKEAFLQLSITDLKGLNGELKLTCNNTPLAFTPDVPKGASSTGGLAAPIDFSLMKDLNAVDFSTQINLSGAEQLMFAPVGKLTTVNLQSKWPNPSFTGNSLPQSSTVNKEGFAATWKSLSYEKSFPQRFTEEVDTNFKKITAASFGVSLYMPVNTYQKTMRSIKYAIFCIVLTFAGFFLIETVNKRFVHPFNYGLIGLALVLFYTLLLSFSEYIGFNAAYCIASVCIIGLIGWFVNGLLNSNRLSVLLSVILLLLYSYVFTVLQLQDYALILGSVGLFLTLAVVMYFSRRIQW